MADFTPFLQLIHISDLHISKPNSSEAKTLREHVRKAGTSLPPSIMKAIEDGTAPYDRQATARFREFLQELVSRDSVWSECKTWLVDTGDLTSLGDQNSLNLGLQIHNDLAKVCPNFASIYGNHDAWPGKFPF